MKSCRLALLGFSTCLFIAGNVQAAGGLIFLSETAGGRMTDDDFTAMTKAAIEALDDPTTPSMKVWTNPKTGSGGTVKTTQAFTAKSGEPCKQVLHNTQAKGLTHEATSNLCKINDKWKLVSEDFAIPPPAVKK